MTAVVSYYEVVAGFYYRFFGVPETYVINVFFLERFSVSVERSVMEKYLIYATAFGIAEKVNVLAASYHVVIDVRAIFASRFKLGCVV